MVGHRELAMGVLSFAWAHAMWNQRSLGLHEIRSFCVCLVARIRGLGWAAWEDLVGLIVVRSAVGVDVSPG